ncbi:MHJ_0274 family protein [Mesomycoplasma neurolyticum]|uniref:Uncharacterized protein n=1 Tax=Mesomycoplasma neurolyticum TaxID=2120 RepID=A0A449A4Z7_9BACT|nr:hypothetical protein [Mesomycoplasma neurolyticum]VEU59370.1 Uncharacterised protein [Mesomycoplasma neurolyticum]
MDNNTIMFIVIAAILVISIVIVVLFQVITERKKKKKIKIEKEKILENQRILTEEITYKINAIIEKNEELLNNFVVSIGDFKMKELNFFTKNEIKKIIKHPQFYQTFADNPYLDNSDFNDNLNILIETKSNLWSKKNQSQIQFFANIEKQYLNDDAKKENYLNLKKEFKNSLVLNDKK